MQSIEIDISKYPNHWNKLLDWSNQFPYVAAFQPQQVNNYPFGAFPKSIAVGNRNLKLPRPYFSSLREYLEDNPEKELFGYLGYDLKNELEDLKSENTSFIEWPPMDFFHSDCIMSFQNDALIIQSDQLDFFQKEIRKVLEQKRGPSPAKSVVYDFKSWTNKQEYIDTVNTLKNHIEEGDIYEINFCINFSASVQNFKPTDTFQLLSSNSPSPFASFLKMDRKYIISASPERFIKLKNSSIISQPIKGTAGRGKTKAEDEQKKKALFESEKERAENMMIVDLVRNDLAKSSESGSVKVEEIFGIYSFPQVHQMISTVSATKKHDIHPVEVIKNAFPMGSMTGAPKISAMKLIEFYENHKRNVFSGSIGYFKGAEEFDFNVLIRSIYYDESTQLLNYNVGSAITYDSIAESEYEECLLKAQAIEKTLGLI